MSMETLPASIRILGKTYRIVEDSGLRDNGYRGRAYHIELVIKLAAGQPMPSKVETLIHEILHGISYHLDMGLKEQVVQQLSTGIYAVLVDNGLLSICECGVEKTTLEEGARHD